MAGFNEALEYVRAKLAEFDRVGRVELPQLRQQITQVWHAASAAGDVDLEQRARAEFDYIAELGKQWELHNDTIQGIRSALRSVGVSLGVVPAWVIPVVVGLASGIALMLLARDNVKDAVTDMYREAVARGVLTPQQAARELQEFDDRGVSWPAALVTVALVGAALWFLPRSRSAA